MKTKFNLIPALALGAVLLPLAVLTPAKASLSQYGNVAFYDNFNDGNDTGWSHLSIFALSTGQIWDASSGSYRLYAPANGYNPGTGAYGFVGSAVSSISSFTDGYVQADIVAFLGGGPTQSPNPALGLGARMGGLGTPLGLTGYYIAYEPTGNSGGPTLRLYWFGGSGVFNSLGAVNVNLDTNLDYTLTLETTGSSIVGSLWQLGQVGQPGGLIGQVSATDTHYTSGYTGLVGVTQQPLPPADTTWDNFIVMVPEPGTGALLGLALAGFLARRRLGWKRS